MAFGIAKLPDGIDFTEAAALGLAGPPPSMRSTPRTSPPIRSCWWSGDRRGGSAGAAVGGALVPR